MTAFTKIAANGVTLAYDERGRAGDPAILLIMGLGTQAIAWPEAFCDALAANGFRVIRYDNRDVGEATHLAGAKAPNPLLYMAAAKLGVKLGLDYTLADMADDAAALLDALGITRAHVVGASMGGMIAQLVAVRHPRRVLSLTSIMSSSGAPGLPGPSPELRRAMLGKRPDPADRAATIAATVKTLKLIAYPDAQRRDADFADIAARALDRGFNPMGFRRQLLAIIADGSRADRLARIAAPTLVIHGAADLLVPLANGADTARRIPGARLEVIDAMAHDLPPSQLPRLVELIARHAHAAAEASNTKSPEPPTPKEHIMADDKSMADRIIEPLKKGGEQVRAAGEKLMADSSTVNLKVLDHAQKNAMEAFTAMRAAASSSSLKEVMEIQSNFIREQAARSMEQAREVGEMIAQFGRSAVAPMMGKKDE